MKWRLTGQNLVMACSNPDKFITSFNKQLQVAANHTNDNQRPHTGTNTSTNTRTVKTLSKAKGRAKKVCPLCRKSFVNLVNHIRIHTNEKPFKCPNVGCLQVFTESGNLARHKANCCKSKFNSKSVKSWSSKRTPPPTRTRMCSICQKSMNCSSYQLQVHERSHTSEKPFPCAFCSKKFAAKYYLKLHERIHTNDKRFSCKLCNARFIQWNHLNGHLNSARCLQNQKANKRKKVVPLEDSD